MDLLGGTRLDLDGLADLPVEQGRPERGLVRDHVVGGIAVPCPEDGVAGARPIGVPQFDDAPDSDRVGRHILEVCDAGAGEVALEHALLGHEDLLVLLRHLVL